MTFRCCDVKIAEIGSCLILVHYATAAQARWTPLLVMADPRWRGLVLPETPQTEASKQLMQIAAPTEVFGVGSRTTPVAIVIGLRGIECYIEELIGLSD